jgi:Protein of unknown function (DUF2510)/TM2 domain
MTTNTYGPQNPPAVNPRPPLPGWYPDPSRALGQRYVNGVDWAHQYAPVASGPPKSALAAGLLEFCFGWFGVGRFYICSIGIAGTQITLGASGLFLLGIS